MRSILGVVALLALAGGAWWVVRGQQTVAMTTPYQAVLLSNGSAYFGRLEGLGSAYPVLKEVYYVQSRPGQDGKPAVNTLVKRGKEWHGPDRMILTASAIVFVEPVNPGSRVSQLIAEAAATK
ncbi:MAG: hypothetical protein JWN34_4867 [Bryobacterales bacterium]|nr:hypothetical protein [Bryobacterales bacterium]